MPDVLFDEVLLDPNVFQMAEGAPVPLTGGPEYANAHIFNRQTGVYKTAVLRYDPREMLDANITAVRPEHVGYLVNFVRGGYGSAVGFRARVPHDYVAVREAFAASDGATLSYKLYKTYTRPGVTERQDVRRITKPVAAAAQERNGFQLLAPDGAGPRVIENAFRLYLDNTELISGWTVDVRTGTVYFTANPGAGTLYWSGEHDTPMAFTGNNFTFRVDRNGDMPGVGLREILPAELGID